MIAARRTVERGHLLVKGKVLYHAPAKVAAASREEKAGRKSPVSFHGDNSPSEKSSNPARYQGDAIRDVLWEKKKMRKRGTPPVRGFNSPGRRRPSRLHGHWGMQLGELSARVPEKKGFWKEGE